MEIWLLEWVSSLLFSVFVASRQSEPSSKTTVLQRNVWDRVFGSGPVVHSCRSYKRLTALRFSYSRAKLWDFEVSQAILSGWLGSIPPTHLPVYMAHIWIYSIIRYSWNALFRIHDSCDVTLPTCCKTCTNYFFFTRQLLYMHNFTYAQFITVYITSALLTLDCCTLYTIL